MKEVMVGDALKTSITSITYCLLTQYAKSDAFCENCQQYSMTPHRFNNMKKAATIA